MIGCKHTLNLNYKEFGHGFPVIILHGLLGSLDNWQTIARHLSEKGLQVYVLDQRNHGRSPHSNLFDYDLMVLDLWNFIGQHEIEKAHVIGHSMGGKVAMKFALEHPNRVQKLVVVDVAPVKYEARHTEVFEALFAADVRTATSRQGVEATLRNYLKEDEMTVQFLMKGLVRAEKADAGFEWRFNLEALWANYERIAGGIDGEKPFEGRTLFIKGEKSDYISAENFDRIDKLFPNNELVEIKDAGHWVHAEKPQEFLAEVIRFLQKAKV